MLELNRPDLEVRDVEVEVNAEDLGVRDAEVEVKTGDLEIREVVVEVVVEVSGLGGLGRMGRPVSGRSWNSRPTSLWSAL